MELRLTEADAGSFDRVYGMDAVLKNFKGCPHLEITLFRYGYKKEELTALVGKNLVGAPDPDVPPAVLQGATEERGLLYILENFTREEVDQFIAYAGERYGDQIEELIVAPLDIPVPLGTGPLAAIPVTRDSGFICFDKALDYPLPFAVRAYFDFTLQDKLAQDHV
ncbi:MAG: hypothetical protein IJU76_12150 [Desulfovibrionaceae bacterium]|nr:hypothetical protein [Desulfovibrionaceae bacterium]